MFFFVRLGPFIASSSLFFQPQRIKLFDLGRLMLWESGRKSTV